jgi:hypothetical protein
MAESPNGVAEASAGSAFLSRDFRLYQTARLLVILGAEAQSGAVLFPALPRADALSTESLMPSNIQQSIAEPVD